MYETIRKASLLEASEIASRRWLGMKQIFVAEKELWVLASNGWQYIELMEYIEPHPEGPVVFRAAEFNGTVYIAVA